MKIIMSIINKVRIFKENPPLIKGFKLKEVDNSLLENKYIYTNINSLLKNSTNIILLDNKPNFLSLI